MERSKRPPPSLPKVYAIDSATNFTIVQPSGVSMSRDKLVDALQAGYGHNPDFQIGIRNVALVHVDTDVVVATYQEWQRNAKSSTPPTNGRSSTSVFLRTNNPRELRWRHVHETWLPADQVAVALESPAI